MQVKSPFTYIGQTRLGKIYRPYAIISIFSKQRNKWQPVEMIIDSGADYCLLPKKYADILGINLKTDCWEETTLGVGGAEKVYQYKGLLIRIGSWERKVAVGFLDKDDLPPLLGRLDCLETFKLTFNKRVSVFSIY